MLGVGRAREDDGRIERRERKEGENEEVWESWGAGKGEKKSGKGEGRVVEERLGERGGEEG